MKKKLIALLLCGFTTFSLFGCTSTETKKADAVSGAEKDISETETSDTVNNEPTEPKGPDYESGTNPELLEGITYEVPKSGTKKYLKTVKTYITILT
ncbi:hypothetical protein LC724_33225 [Blautia sp. RD014234]|nr:hypothetical protein [Blautia parvula]